MLCGRREGKTHVFVLGEEASPSLSISKIACHTKLNRYTEKTCYYNQAAFRKIIPMNDPKLVRVQEKGQVTIPTEIRKKLGLKRGDLVAVMETPEGIFITPQQLVATKALDSIGDILKEQGLSLEEVISSGRQIRTAILQEQ
jgi:antitoxin PrlF